jgi:hypothetical protein
MTDELEKMWSEVGKTKWHKEGPSHWGTTGKAKHFHNAMRTTSTSERLTMITPIYKGKWVQMDLDNRYIEVMELTFKIHSFIDTLEYEI